MTAYTFDHSRFAFETFGDEIVVLNLDDGTYFAFGGSAVEIWPALVGSEPVGRIIEAFPDEASDRNIRDFVAKLVQEGMLIATETGANGAAASVAATNGFRPISFEKHTDMKDLLTLDPIHDVDPHKGWPNN